MTEEGSGSFGSFWHRSIDKLSSKTVKFMPNVTNPGNGKSVDEADSSSLTPKQRRRIQVRKAQKEHRERKENYVKHLEQDVIDLREMIAQAETQSVLLKHENGSIRTTLLNSNIPIPEIVPIIHDTSKHDTDVTTPPTILQAQPPQSNLSSSSSPPEVQWPSSSGGSLVSMTFDDIIDASCLQITPSNFIPDNDVLMTSSDFFDFPANPYAGSLSSRRSPGPDPQLSKALPRLPDEATAISPSALKDLSTVAINFILALEHPCRTHFHAQDPTFNPKGSPSGHELMASTLLYNHAPPPVFESFSSPAPTSTTPPSEIIEWTAPSPELKQLYDMSQSLPKGDWEITPVQAWFLLMGRFGANTLLADGGEELLTKLKKGLGKLVGCFAFGAVMDLARFWEAVDGVWKGEEIVTTL